MRSIDEINQKIRQGQAVVETAEAFKSRVQEQGLKAAAQTVDVVVTSTFEPMESSGAILNLGHTDPPIKLLECYLDGVPAYAGFGAVDIYIGASQPALSPSGRSAGLARPGDPLDVEEVHEHGGGHVIADLIAGRGVRLQATGHATDCYPRKSLDTTITRDSVNQFYLFNPRCLYQNFIVGVNGGERPLSTYLGPLQPGLGNAVYSNLGALSPLLNDPDLNAIGVGTRIFLGGGVGYLAWEGTQHFPLQRRLPNRTPVGPAATVALIGDAKQMTPRWVRGCYFRGYGPSMMLGVGVPIPILNENLAQHCAVQDSEILAPVMDFSIPRRVRPTFGLVSYAQLKSGTITIEGQPVRTAPLASLHLSRQIANELKQWIVEGQFELSTPVAALPKDRAFLPQDALGP